MSKHVVLVLPTDADNMEVCLTDCRREHKEGEAYCTSEFGKGVQLQLSPPGIAYVPCMLMLLAQVLLRVWGKLGNCFTALQRKHVLGTQERNAFPLPEREPTHNSF